MARETRGAPRRAASRVSAGERAVTSEPVAALLVSVVAAPDLRHRFARAGRAEPLCALAPDAQAELAAQLDRVRDFDELPGKWQAALLRAEAASAGAPLPDAGGSCCGGAQSANSNR